MSRLSTKTKAAVIHRFGGPDAPRIEEVAMPIPSQGEFLIEVDAASVNPVDYKIRTGKYKMFRLKLAAIIERDIRHDAGVLGVAALTAWQGLFNYGHACFSVSRRQRASELA